MLAARVRGLGALVPWLRATVFATVLAGCSEGYCFVLIWVLARSAARTPGTVRRGRSPTRSCRCVARSTAQISGH